MGYRTKVVESVERGIEREDARDAERGRRAVECWRQLPRCCRINFGGPQTQTVSVDSIERFYRLPVPSLLPSLASPSHLSQHPRHLARARRSILRYRRRYRRRCRRRRRRRRRRRNRSRFSRIPGRECALLAVLSSRENRTRSACSSREGAAMLTPQHPT